MGGDHRGVTDHSDRGSASTIVAPKARQQLPAPAAKLEDHRKSTSDRAKAAATPAARSNPTVAPASPHVSVTPQDRRGSSTIVPPASTGATTPMKAIEAKPVEPELVIAPLASVAPNLKFAPLATETSAVAEKVEEVIGGTKGKVIGLLAQFATEEPGFPKDGSGAEKRARAAWMSRSLAALARAVLSKRPDVSKLTEDANLRNQLIHDLRDPLKAMVGNDAPTRPRFLG